MKRCSVLKSSKVLVDAMLVRFKKRFPIFFSQGFNKDTFGEFAIASGTHLAFEAR
jgi:hypothetical protein